jgi:hypothetical protein
MKRILFLGLVCCAIISVSGCASVTTGRYQHVPIDSHPQGADVTVSSGFRGITPCSFQLPRNMDHVVNIAKKGYRTAQVQLRRTIAGSTAGNLLIGGIIGLGVDAMTGACWKIIPENVYVDLVPGKEDDVVVIEAPKTEQEIAKEKLAQKELEAAAARKQVTTKDETEVTAKDGMPVTTSS